MKTLRVTLETVTPLFLGGADPRDRNSIPELRPPSFRGQMRYWLRAVLGGVIGDKNPEGLRLLESKVLGNTERGSPISITLSGNPSSSVHSILPHKPDRGRRNAFNSNQAFELTLRMNRPGLKAEDEVAWVNASMALNMIFLFGGVGLRSRRGFGSLRVVESSDQRFIPLTPLENEKWYQYLDWIPRNAFKYAQYLAQLHGILTTNLPHPPTEFPCASHGVIVRVAENIVTNKANDSLKEFMSVMPQASFLGGINPRQASPLWIRVFRANNKYRLLLCVLPSKLISGTSYSNLSGFLNKSFPGQDISIKGWNHE